MGGEPASDSAGSRLWREERLEKARKNQAKQANHEGNRWVSKNKDLDGSNDACCRQGASVGCHTNTFVIR